MKTSLEKHNEQKWQKLQEGKKKKIKRIIRKINKRKKINDHQAYLQLKHNKKLSEEKRNRLLFHLFPPYKCKLCKIPLQKDFEYCYKCHMHLKRKRLAKITEEE